MSLRKTILVGFSILTLVGLSGCATLSRGEQANISPTPPTKTYLLTDSVKLTQAPILGTDKKYPTGWGVGEGTKSADGTISPGGEVTPTHVLLFSQDKKCSFEVTQYFTVANSLTRGDLFETKTLLYQKANSANGEITKESTAYVNSNLGQVQFSTGSIPQNIKNQNPNADIMMRVFGDDITNPRGKGFPFISGIYSCQTGTNLDPKTFTELTASLTLTLK